MLKMNAAQLRKTSEKCNPTTTLRARAQSSKLRKNNIYIILDDVLDTYNVGGIFRLADAVAAKKVYLCGKTETPPNPRIKKASINTTEIVAWEYCASAAEAISKIKDQRSKIQIIAIEQSPNSVPYDKFEYKMPLCLVVGNESYGVSKEVLQSRMLDGVVEIPMYGVNISLNVIVSLGIVVYKAIKSSCALAL